MPLEESKFEKLNDMLIRIDENTKNFRTEFGEHRTSDATEFSSLKQSNIKVHERLDKLKEDMKGDFLKQSEETRNSSGFQNKVMGAICLITFIIPLIVAWYLKKGV